MSAGIHAASENPTIQFAKKELSRYIDAMQSGGDDRNPMDIQICLLSDVFAQREYSATAFDDEIYIDLHAGNGVVAGINPRSCLLAVYRLLREAGCRFLRPGANGEMIPQRNWEDVTVHVDEKPSYRHRGICIEGAVSRELFLDMIDWLPKNGMNAYFVQFRSGYTFFERWYAHRHNPDMKPELKTAEDIRHIVDEGIEEIKLRGLIYHEVGHGWTCEPLGIPAFGWDAVEDVPAGATDAFALINGRRALWGNVPMNTNLCYGNVKNRDMIIESMVTYLQQNPMIDILHFWLADDSNNHCECPLCADTRPSDFYVEMMNRLDERLSELSIHTKIAFLIYFDLLWPPEKQQIVNPERFILMFAPITRTYTESFSPTTELPALPPYQRNHLVFPTTVEGNIAFLRAWQTFFSGDSFDFDYHLLWIQFKTPGYESIAKVLYDDIGNLTNIGLNGLMSCQVHRSFFPSPLPTAVLGQTLWNKETDYSALADDLYVAAYGKDGLLVRAILQQLSTLFNSKWLLMEEPVVNAAQARQLQKIPEVVEDLQALVAAQPKETNECRRESWRLLQLYCTYAEKLAAFALEVTQANADNARKALGDLIRWVFTQEESLGYALDCDTMRYTLEDLYKHMVEKMMINP